MFKCESYILTMCKKTILNHRKFTILPVFSLYNSLQTSFYWYTPLFDINIRYSSMQSNRPQWGSNSDPSDWESASLTIWPRRHFQIQFGNFSGSIFKIKIKLSITFDNIKFNNKLITRIDCYNLEKSCTLFSRLWKRTVSMLNQVLYDYSLN